MKKKKWEYHEKMKKKMQLLWCDMVWNCAGLIITVLAHKSVRAVTVLNISNEICSSYVAQDSSDA